MANLGTITVDLDEIRTRAQAVSQIRINRNTTPEDEIRSIMYTLDRAIEECRLAEYALKVEQLKADQTMADAGYEPGSESGEDGVFGRHVEQFRQLVETFTRRIAALERVLEERSEHQE